MRIQFRKWTQEDAWRLLGWVLATGATLAALWCFESALRALPAASTGGILFDPHVTFHDPASRAALEPFADTVPMVAVWPIVLIIAVFEAMTPGALYRPEVTNYLLGTVGALIAANVVGYLRQDGRNRPALFGVAMWSMSLGLSIFELASLVTIPQLWKGSYAGFAFGTWLRAAELGTWLAFIGALAPIYLNRVRPDALQAFANVMWQVRFGLILYGAVAAMTGPFFAHSVASTYDGMNQNHHPFGSWLLLIFQLGLAWLVFVGPVWKQLSLGFGLVFQLLLTRPLLGGASGGSRKTHQMPPGRTPGV